MSSRLISCGGRRTHQRGDARAKSDGVRVPNPAVILHAMARFVIDPPTLLHIVDCGVSIDPAHQLVAPNSVRSEALERLLREVREGQRTEKAALQCHERMTELKIRLLGDRVSRRTAWKIAFSHNWDSLRDAEYLAVTRLQADALITVDRRFAAVATPFVRVATLDALLIDSDL
jgi:predicted nucleic acid-binding protein